MNAQRMFKEARPLFWPWCAVVCAGALPLLHPAYPLNQITRVGFILGIPLLAALPFGNEFQNRTFSLLLSQPIRRMEIWREKLSIAAIVVLTATVVFFFSWWVSGVHAGREFWGYPAAAAIVLLASAPFWTLFTRSIVGGLFLSFGVYNFIVVLGLQALYWGSGYSRPPDSTFISTMSAVFLVYAGLMLWLGWRKLASFQAIGHMAGDDRLTAGADLLPGAWLGWLRCRPSGAVLNLIRKEFRLLRPVWLISLLAAVGWACLTLPVLLHPQGLTRSFETAVVGAGVITTLMIAILAGSLSLGEEKTSGTHSSYLTLPVSARRQWLIKLFMAIFAGFLGAGLLPLLIAGPFFGKYHILADFNLRVSLPLVAVLLTFTAFWCACAANGTVRAVLWVFPVLIALYFAGELGKWAGPAITDLFFSRFDPFANLRVANAVSSMFEPFAISRFAFWEFSYNRGYIAPMVGVILVPTFFSAVIQSYRLFRAQLQDSALSLVRNLLPLALVAFLCSFSFMVFFSFVARSWNQKSIALLETIQAIQKIQPGAAKLDATHPLQLTVEDLAKASPVSKSTRRLLGNSHITLALEEPPHHGHFGCAENPQPRGLPALGYSWYSAVIPLADGSHFFVAFEPGTHSFISAGFCK